MQPIHRPMFKDFKIGQTFDTVKGGVKIVHLEALGDSYIKPKGMDKLEWHKTFKPFVWYCPVMPDGTVKKIEVDLDGKHMPGRELRTGRDKRMAGKSDMREPHFLNTWDEKNGAPGCTKCSLAEFEKLISTKPVSDKPKPSPSSSGGRKE